MKTKLSYRGRTLPAVLIVTALFSGLLFAGCDSVVNNVQEEETLETTVLSAEQQELRAKLQQAALLLVDVAKDEKAVASVHEGVQLRRKAGHDENVTFAQLLGRRENATVNSTSAKIAQAGKPFAKAFRSALNKRKSDVATNASGDFDLEAYLIENDAIIYWPYAENFEGVDVTAPVLVPHPILEGDSDVFDGYDPVTDEEANAQSGVVTSAMSRSYKIIGVDESYATTNPVWVVAPSEGGRTSSAKSDDTKPSGSVVRVSLGWVQCRKNYDKWISGGSELRFVRVEPTAINGDVSSSKTEIEVNVSRKDCGKKRWKEVKTSWDSNWEKEDVEQGFVVYEWDRFTFRGEWKYSLGYKGDAGVKGLNIDTEAKGSVKFNNGGPIYKTTINRDSYLAFNGTDVDLLGMKDGFGMRGAGTGVRFTLPHNLYSPSTNSVEQLASK